MVLTLHHFPPSAPSRAALLTAKAIGLDIDVQIVNLFEKEQLSEDFIKFPILFLGEDQILDENKQPLEEALGFLDVFLDENSYVAGDKLTVADCSLAASVSSIVAIGWDIKAYENVNNWLARCALTIPGYEETNQAGANEFGKAVRSKMAPGQLP
ncbi:hypothetical protein YQE_08747, partial [Dendroctonus ponderosae]